MFQEDDVLYNVGVVRLAQRRVHLHRGRRLHLVGVAGHPDRESDGRAAGDRAAPAERRVPVEHGGDYFYLVTNDNARNFRIRPRGRPRRRRSNGRDWSPHRDDAFVEGLDVFETFAVVVERRDGLRRAARRRPRRPTQSHDITFPEEAYGVLPTGNPEFKTDIYPLHLLVVHHAVVRLRLQRGDTASDR